MNSKWESGDFAYSGDFGMSVWLLIDFFVLFILRTFHMSEADI